MTGRTDSARAGEWDRYGSEWITERPDRLWRQHSDAVNTALIEAWLPSQRAARVLKTDLFDEAVSDGVCRAIARRSESVVGLDVSISVCAAAARGSPEIIPAGADVRRLPFDDDVFDAVVSLSTLDHFDDPADVLAALKEIYRVTAPGGTLILTLDNLANPVIAVRNSLPYGLTHAAGLVPYPVGRTFRPGEARALAAESGFEVIEQTAVMHAPRVIAVPLMRSFAGNESNGAARMMLSAAMWFEKLKPLPTRFLTGHFIAIRAIKRS